jgi:hypothetical protein
MRAFALAMLVAMPAHAATGASSCVATQPTALVELFTSEGCSSCPPADHWADQLSSKSSIAVVGFHVDYWDYLGWRDRFASADYTAWQRRRVQHSGARVTYTPAVFVDGAEQRSWSRLRSDDVAAKSNTVATQLSVRAAGSGRLEWQWSPAAAGNGLYVALTESGLTSAVAAGENTGRRLRHAPVVRQFARAEGSSGTLKLPTATGALRLVVWNERDGRVLAARQVDLQCLNPPRN